MTANIQITCNPGPSVISIHTQPLLYNWGVSWGLLVILIVYKYVGGLAVNYKVDLLYIWAP